MINLFKIFMVACLVCSWPASAQLENPGVKDPVAVVSYKPVKNNASFEILEVGRTHPLSDPSGNNSSLLRMATGSHWSGISTGMKSGQEPTSTPSTTPVPSTSFPDAPSGRRVADWQYWTVTAGLLGSSVAHAQTLSNCPNCTAVSSNLRRPGVLYGVGLPADAAVSYLGYYLKKNGHRWWLAPAVAIAAANAALAYHWASSTN